MKVQEAKACRSFHSQQFQLIIAKFDAAASHPDDMVAVFGDAPLRLIADPDAASVAKLMSYFLDDLKKSVITTALGIFSEVPELLQS